MHTNRKHWNVEIIVFKSDIIDQVKVFNPTERREKENAFTLKKWAIHQENRAIINI